MKVIHLLCHTIPNKKDYIFDGWPARTAQKILRYSSSFQHECWFAVEDLVMKKAEKKDGIIYRLFPAWTLNKTLESFFGIIFSNGLISSLKETLSREKAIIHIQGERSLLVWQIIKVAKCCPIILQIHGYSTPKTLEFLEKYLFAPLERYYFKNINYFFSSVIYRTNYLVCDIGIPKERIINQNLGVDYELFKPMNSLKVKKKLGIPQNKKVILYIGLFNETKGVKKIIDAHLNIKDKFNTYLILIGGNKNDQYYDYSVNNADMVLERIHHDLLPKYFNAADIYCMVCPEEKAKYGGLGIASMEAVACNVPILNSNLKDAPRKLSAKIGYEVHSTADLVEKMKLVFQHKDRFADIRDISKSYFSWESIMKNTLKIYHSFSKRRL